jgi:hypothetical protein
MEHQKELEAIHDIRRIMNRSTRFLSLSGLSGVFAGSFAILGALAAYWKFGYRNNLAFYNEHSANAFEPGMEALFRFLFWDATIVLVASVAAGFFFTLRKAKREGAKVFDKTGRRLMYHFAVPLLTGGIFCLALLSQKLYGLAAPATLIFYGLAVFQASKYTFDDVRYMGLVQIGLGLLGLFLPGYGLLLWTIGFGVVHVLYGLILWNKYDRKSA